jgi:hypothetical protein
MLGELGAHVEAERGESGSLHVALSVLQNDLAATVRVWD